MLWWLRPCNVYVRPSPPPKSTNYIVLLAVKLIIAHKIYPNVSLKSNCAFFLLLINILEKISCQIPSQLSPRKFQSSIWVERKKSYHGLAGGENTLVTQKTLLWVSRRKCLTKIAGFGPHSHFGQFCMIMESSGPFWVIGTKNGPEESMIFLNGPNGHHDQQITEILERKVLFFWDNLQFLGWTLFLVAVTPLHWKSFPKTGAWKSCY